MQCTSHSLNKNNKYSTKQTGLLNNEHTIINSELVSILFIFLVTVPFFHFLHMEEKE